MIIAYIDGRKPASPVVPICRVLSETGIQIAPSTCQAALKTPVSARELTGVYLVDAVVACFPRPPRGLGLRTLWHLLPRAGHRWAVTRSDG